MNKLNNITSIFVVLPSFSGGRLLTVVRYDADEQIHDFSKKVSYDNEGKVTAVLRSMTYLRGTTEEYFTHQNVYNYNPDGSLRSEIIASGDSVTVNYEYDAFDRLVEKSANNGITTSYEYREFGTNQTDLLVTGYTNTINGVDSTYTYEYDSNGNITKITHGISVITYTYDDLGQLESEVYRTINDSFTGTSVYYLYDKAGNLKLIKTYTDTPEGSFLASEKDYTYTDSEWGDLLTRFNGTYIHYDDMGNPSNYYGNRTFVWTGRLMTKAFLRGVNQLITLTYDDDGVRTSKNRAGVVTNYYYDGTTLIAEETNGAITVYLYDSTGSPVGMQYRDSSYAYNSWDVYWFAKNLQGDVVAVYSDTGTLLVEYEYDPWGEFTVTYYNNGANTSAVNNNLRYRGYYYDSDIQLYYLISRYYDSNTGRFISPDCHINANGGILGHNMYAYCSNNPIMNSDTGGESIIGIFLGLIADPVTTIIVLAGASVDNHVATGIVTIAANDRAEEIAGKGKDLEESVNKYFEEEYTDKTNIPRLEITSKQTNFKIYNGDTVSAIDRMAISKLLADSGYTDRSQASLAAEWSAHNLATLASWRRFSRTYDVDLDFDFSTNKDYTKLATIICEFLGVY